MELRELSTETMTEIYHRYMTVDFPREELKPLEHILYMLDKGMGCAYGIYEEEKLRGYATFIVPDGLRYGLLDYLAVLEQYRGTGIGHAFFDLIRSTLCAKYPALQGFFIESENIAYAADDRERQVREKRISFYVQNGCAETTLESRLFGVNYSILVYDFDRKADSPVTIEDLKNIYRVMFRRHHYENEVDFWDNFHE